MPGFKIPECDCLYSRGVTCNVLARDRCGQGKCGFNPAEHKRRLINRVGLKRAEALIDQSEYLHKMWKAEDVPPISQFEPPDGEDNDATEI